MTLVRGRDARGCPFRLQETASTPTRSPLFSVGDIDLGGSSTWHLNFYQGQAEGLLPYLFRFADTGRLHNAARGAQVEKKGADSETEQNGFLRAVMNRYDVHKGKKHAVEVLWEH